MFFHSLAVIDILTAVNVLIVVLNALAAFLGAKKGAKAPE